jgi:nucleotide-binding universal stress UspA family protein
MGALYGAYASYAATGSAAGPPVRTGTARPGRSAPAQGPRSPCPGGGAARTLEAPSPPSVARARRGEVFLERRPVVVGLDGSPESLAAGDWAAREALRRGLPLRLLYAFEGLPSDASDLPELAAPRYWAARILRGTMDRLAETFPQVPLSAEQIALPAPEALLSAEAEVLVLGNRAFSGFAGLLADSLGLATVARAPGPVVLVPAEYEHVPQADSVDRPVVVGVDTAHPCDEVLDFAFDAARLRRAPLHAVHTWHPRHVHGQSGHASREDAERALEAALGPWREKYPNVDVHRIVDNGRAAQRLLHAAAAARLLVVGRRIRPARLGPHTGPVAHAVLHHARCPVAIVPHE